MCDPLLSFVGEGDFLTSPNVEEESSELALFPELLESCAQLEKVGSITSAGRKSTENKSEVKPNSKGKAAVIKVKMVPNQEEELIEYLTGRCQNSGFELDNIVEVTAAGESDADGDGDDNIVTVDLGDLQSAMHGALSPTGSSVSIGSEVDGQINTGRTETQSEVVSLSGRPACNLSASKAAQSARENRMKKKNYVNGLQNSVNKLSSENNLLKTEVGNLKNTVDSLSTEVLYLKNVLANQSTLSSLLKNTLKTPGVQFLSSEFDLEGTTVTQRVPTKGMSSQKRATKRSLEEDLYLSSDDENNCNDAKSATMQRKTVRLSQVTTRLGSRKMTKLDHDYAGFKKSAGSNSPARILPTRTRGSDADSAKENVNNSNHRTTSAAGGICLHIMDKTVSLEFCAECSKKATISRRSPRTSYSQNRNVEQVQV